MPSGEKASGDRTISHFHGEGRSLLAVRFAYSAGVCSLFVPFFVMV